MTPSLLCGNWEVEHALFDRISNTVSSRLVMIILVVFFAVDGDIARSLCINFQVSELLLQSSFETWLLLSCGSLSSIRDVF